MTSSAWDELGGRLQPLTYWMTCIECGEEVELPNGRPRVSLCPRCTLRRAARAENARRAAANRSREARAR